MAIDVDAKLNYGKTQITDMHLINRVRRFANDAYRATIQSGAGLWVGTIVEDGDDEEQHDIFVQPLEQPWNRQGMCNNMAQRVDVIVE